MNHVLATRPHCDEGCRMVIIIAGCPFCRAAVERRVWPEDLPVIERHGLLCDACFEAQEAVR